METKKTCVLRIVMLGLLLTQFTAIVKAKIAIWPLDDGSGTTATDSQGSNDATLSGTQNWGTDYFSFNGSSYFNTDYDISIKCKASFKISAIIKTTTNGGRIWSRQPSSGWASGSHELYINNNAAAFHMSNVGIVQGTTTVTDGNWHTVELVFIKVSDSYAYLSLYVDGQLDTTSDSNSANWHYYGHPAISWDYELEFCIGARKDSTYTKFNGDIKNVELHIYPIEYAAQWLLNDGSGTVADDSSGNINDASLTGTANWGTDYFSLNGSSYFSAAYSASMWTATSFRISTTFRTTTNGGRIWSRQPSAGWDKGSHELYIENNSPKFHISYVGLLQGTTTVTDGNWHTVDVIFRRMSNSYATVAIYTDGQLDVFSESDASNSWHNYGLPTLTDFDYDLGFCIGAREGSAYAKFNGDIRNVQLDISPSTALPGPIAGYDRTPYIINVRNAPEWLQFSISCFQGLANRYKAQTYLDWGPVDTFWLNKFNDIGYNIETTEIAAENLPSLMDTGEIFEDIADGLLVYDDLAVMGGKQEIVADIWGTWALDDASGTTAADSSIYGINAALTGSTNGWQTGYYSFDGSSHFEIDKDANDFNIDMSNSFYFEAMIKTTTGGTVMARTIDPDYTWSAGSKKLDVYQGKLYFDCSYVNGLSGNTSVNDGNWHKAAVKFDSSTGIVTLYVDGDIDAVSSSGAFSGMTAYGDSLNLLLGVQCKSGGSWYNHFSGDMKEVSISDIPLSKIVGKWTLSDGSGATAEDTAGTSNATLTGTQNWGSDYFTFNGTSYFDVPYSSTIKSEDSFTISLSFRTTGNGRLWSRHPSTGFESASHELYIESGLLKYHMSGIGLLTGTTTVNDGSWHTVELKFQKRKDIYACVTICLDDQVEATSDSETSNWHYYGHPDITTYNYNHILRIGSGDRDGSGYGGIAADIKNVILEINDPDDNGDWSMLTNIFTAIAAQENLIPVPARVADQWPLTVVIDATTRSSRTSGLWTPAYDDSEAYEWVIDEYPELSSAGPIAHIHPSTLVLRDYFVAFNILPIFYWENIDSTTETIFSNFLEDTGPNQAVLGIWNPLAQEKPFDLGKPECKYDEHQYMRLLCPYGKYIECTGESGISNLSFQSGMHMLKDTFRDEHGPSLTLDSSKVYVAFNITDGDNIGNLWNGFGYTPGRWWDDSNRGDVWINWSYSASMLDLMPGLTSYYYDTATSKDSFLGGGIGYILLDDYATEYTTTRDSLIRDFYTTTDIAQENLDIYSLWGLTEYNLSGTPNSQSDLPELAIACDEMNEGEPFECILLDYNRRSGISSYSDTNLESSNIPIFLTVNNGSTSITDVANTIRSYTPTTKPAFLHVSLINWDWEPDEVELLAEELGSGYVPVDTKNMSQLYYEANN